MATVLIISYTIVCLFLVLTVLLQSGKGGGMGAIGGGGGGGSGSVFGGRGASTFMSKLTAVMAGLFMIISVCLTIVDVSPVQAAADSMGPDETEQPVDGDAAPPGRRAATCVRDLPRRAPCMQMQEGEEGEVIE